MSDFTSLWASSIRWRELDSIWGHISVQPRDMFCLALTVLSNFLNWLPTFKSWNHLHSLDFLILLKYQKRSCCHTGSYRVTVGWSWETALSSDGYSLLRFPYPPPGQHRCLLTCLAPAGTGNQMISKVPSRRWDSFTHRFFKSVRQGESLRDSGSVNSFIKIGMAEVKQINGNVLC